MSTTIINVHVINSRDELICIVPISPDASLGKLKTKICTSYLKHACPNHIRFVFQGLGLTLECVTLRDYKITNLSKVYMISQFENTRNYFWKPFIRHSSLSLMEKNVSCLKPTFRIAFQHHIDKHIHLPGLLSNIHSSLANQWEQYSVCNFIWTDHEPTSRVLLLELSPEFAFLSEDVMLKEIEKVKYKVDGINNTYYGGDSRSWQRYTKQLPLEGTLTILQEQKATIEYQCQEVLKPETWYALVLCHTSHTVGDAIFEDYIIPFKTEEKNHKITNEEK